MSPMPGMSVPGISVAPALLVALRPPIRVTGTVVLAIGVRIVLRAFAGIRDHLLRRSRARGERADQQGRSAQSNDLRHLRLHHLMEKRTARRWRCSAFRD